MTNASTGTQPGQVTAALEAWLFGNPPALAARTIHVDGDQQQRPAVAASISAAAYGLRLLSQLGATGPRMELINPPYRSILARGVGLDQSAPAVLLINPLPDPCEACVNVEGNHFFSPESELGPQAIVLSRGLGALDEASLCLVMGSREQGALPSDFTVIRFTVTGDTHIYDVSFPPDSNDPLEYLLGISPAGTFRDDASTNLLAGGEPDYDSLRYGEEDDLDGLFGATSITAIRKHLHLLSPYLHGVAQLYSCPHRS